MSKSKSKYKPMTKGCVMALRTLRTAAEDMYEAEIAEAEIADIAKKYESKEAWVNDRIQSWIDASGIINEPFLYNWE